MLAAQAPLGRAVVIGIGGVIGSGALASGLGLLLQAALGL